MNTYRYYVEYKEQYIDNQQRYLYLYAESEKQIREMFDEYELVVVDCTEQEKNNVGKRKRLDRVIDRVGQKCTHLHRKI